MFEIGRLTRLDLGVVGENDTREIQIDVSEWLEKWPEAAIVIDVQKPDESYYPAATDVENGVLKWRVMASDVQIAGRGIAQIRAMDFQTRKIYKSRVVQTIIKESIDEKVDEDAPDPFETWVAQSVEAMHNTQTARNEAQAAAGEAENAAEAASESAKEAEAAKQIAVEAAAGAEKDAEAAISAANTAKSAATEAGSSAAAAEAAQTAATRAEQNAEAAADVASSSANTAVGARKETVEAKAATITARNEAQAAAQQASASAAAAASSAGSALSAASRASSAAESANNDAEDAQSAANAANAEAKNAEDSAAAAKEAETGAKAAEEAAVKAAREAAEDVRQSIAEDAETAQQAAERAEESAKDAQEVLASIPEDYTTLAELVAQNKQDILTKAPAIYEAESGALVTVEDAAALPASSIVSTIEPAQPGTGDPSPDNVRPISGFDAVTLTRTGKNLLGFRDFTATASAYTDTCVGGVFRREVTKYVETSYVTGNTGISHIESPHIPAGTYTFTLKRISGVTYPNPYMEVTLSDGSIVNLASGVATVLPLGGTITGIRMKSTAFSEGDATEFVMQLEAGDGTACEPYSGVTLTADLPETVYGGTLDWTTGLLTVTHFAQTYDGTEAWADPGNGMSYTLPNSVPGEAMADNDAVYHLCSHYKPVKHRAPDVQADMSCYTLNGHTLCIKDTSVGTLEGLKTSLAAQAAAGTPTTIVWQLKENHRYTIQLTPQQLDMLKGCNAVWSDAGDTSLVYVADTKMYIDNAVAAIAAAIINN